MRRILVGSLVALALVAVAPRARGDASEEKKPTRGLRFPVLTPDGKTVVFAWRGDIWRAPVAGGAATRLTIHEAQDTKPKVSPDGRWIAFSSKRTGNYDVFVMPVDGGEPRQVTFHSAADIVSDWSPDSKRLLVTSNRDPQPYGNDVYEVDVEGGTPRRITRDGGREGVYSPDGTKIVYARGFNTLYQDAYEGTANHDLYVVDAAGGTPRRLTSTPGNEINAAWSADGATVYALADQKGAINVVAIPAEGGEEKTLTTWKDADTGPATLAWDHRTLAFERDGRLYTLDLATAGAKEAAIPVVVESDVRNSGVDVRTVTEGAEHVSVSPDGSQLAVALRGDLWLLPSAGGEGSRLTNGPATDDWPRFSPDGRRLLYFSDAAGTDDVYVMDVASRQSTPVANGPGDEAFPSWSPDGKRIVFTRGPARGAKGNKDLVILDLETKEEKQITRDPKDDDDAAWSPDGRWIAFDSGRGGAQAIYVMSATGGEAQARRVSSGTGFYQVPTWSADSTMIAYEELDPASGNTGGIWAVRASGGAAIQVSRDGQGAAWTPDGEWIVFTAERNGSKDLYRVRAPRSIDAGERIPFLGRIPVDRKREFGDLFDEAWQKLRERFYDPAMHATDWAALKAKYRPLAVDAEVKDEFYAIVSQMLGELRASHLGIFAGADDEDDGTRQRPTGMLGLDLERAAEGGGGRKVAGVTPKGPADEAGLRVGDVVKSVAGTALDARTDLDRVLGGAAGREVPVVFAKGDGSGEKTVSVRAVSANALASLAYSQWVERSKKRVQEATSGGAGYIHLSQMDQTNQQRFDAQLGELIADAKVKGLVLDVRNNGGGNIHPHLLDALSNKPYIRFQPRDGARQTQPALHWGKPIVLLINERSFSDAEVFPYSFKELKLGKVVGVATAGGVIGTNDVSLADGSKFRLPSVGWYGLDGTNLEHLGVKPDVVVEETPEDRLAGKDPQLEKAIELLLRDIGPSPAAAPTPPKSDSPAAAPTPAEPTRPTTR
jgi:tricorn protease